jgi:hypothetical protein
MTELSPAAQIILDAAWEEAVLLGAYQQYPAHRKVLAVAFYALADHVVPANGSHRNNEIRAEILSIASELENY